MKIYLVGGAVRDVLMGRAVHDRDWVVVGSTPEEMISMGFQQVGQDFPVFLHPDTKEEHALARTERRSGNGHRGFSLDASPFTTLEDDLARRDLTINAMAQASDGTVVDPFGGQSDLAGRVLRHVGPAFAEDPLRVMRVARFAAQLPEFRVADETMVLMQDMVARGMVDQLTPERVWQEMHKALAAPSPSRFIELMRQSGALKRVLPEIEALYGVPQPLEHHPEGCAYTHTLLVLDEAAEISSDSIVRFGALVHDVGKGVTPPELLPRHIGHEKAGVPLVRDITSRLRLPEIISLTALRATEHHMRHHQALETRAGRLLRLLMAVGALEPVHGAINLRRFLDICKADLWGRGGAERLEPEQQGLLLRIREAVLEVQGGQFVRQGHAPGPKIGELVFQERVRVAQRVRTMFNRTPNPGLD